MQHQIRDRNIWNKIKAGDANALSELFFNYGDNLFGYGLSLCPNKELVKDCIQELLLDIWSRREKLPQVEQVKFYLLTALRRQIFKNLKTKHISFNPDTLQEELHVASAEDMTIKQESEDATKNNLLDHINLLPDRQKEIIYLRFYQGFSHDDICMIMGIKKQAAWNLLSRAVKKLEALMKNSYSSWGTLCLFHLLTA